MRALAENDTWDLVPTSKPKKNPIDYRWVFKINHNENGMINSFNAWLVAKSICTNPQQNQEPKTYKEARQGS